VVRKIKVCKACGYKGEAGGIIAQRIIPEGIAPENGTSDSGTVELCTNCRNELYIWYSRKVSSLTYDSGMRRFRERLPVEMSKEYEAAFMAFAEYKKRQRKQRK
jgi:hypothetical protein